MAIYSLDQAYCKFTPCDMSYDPNFTPEQSVTAVHFWAGDKPGQTTILVPPWHAPEWFMRRQALQYLDKSSGPVTYLELDDNILSSDAERTIECWRFIAEKYNELILDIGEPPRKWVMSSLGTSIGMFAVGSQRLPAPEIELLTVGGRLSKSLRNGVRTRSLRDQFEA